MFTDLTDEALAVVIADLRSAVLKLVSGLAVAEIRYGDAGRKFHPTTSADARALLNDALAEKGRRAGTRRSGAIHPVGM